MTEHVCTNPDHEHFDASALTPSQRTAIEKQREAFALIAALPGDEERVLTATLATAGIQNILMETIPALLKGDGGQVLEHLKAAVALTGVAGRSLDVLAEAHEDWHKTGDRRVEAVIDVMQEALEAATAMPVLSPADLPEAVAARIEAGTQTEADLEVVRKTAVEKGLVTEEQSRDVDFLARGDGETRPINASNGDDGVYGQYL